MTHAALATRLPALDAREAALRSRLLAALNGPALTAAAFDGHVPAVIRFETPAGDVELAPLSVDGAVPQLLADDGQPDAVGCVAAMAGIEPLIAAVEAVLGVALRPAGVGAPTLPLRLRVTIGGHAAVLGFAVDGSFVLPPASPRLDGFARLRVDFDVTLAGPLLAEARIAALVRGDVVLVGDGRLAARVEASGQRHAAIFEPADRRIALSEESNRVNETASPSLDPDLRLPLTLRIAGGSCTLAELASLAPGSVLPLGIEGATIPVSVEAGGAEVARGELVAIGDAYGVLITRAPGAAS